MKHGLHGSLQANNGQGKELLKILIQASEMMRNASGCLLYLVSIDQEDEDKIWVTEVWETETKHQESLKNPEVRALIGAAMPLLAGAPSSGQKLIVAAGW
jgi:quinol monooxygenase YgiN